MQLRVDRRLEIDTKIFKHFTTVEFGVGAAETIGDKVKEFGGTKALLVTDPGLISTGMIDTIEKYLQDAQIPVVRLDVYKRQTFTHSAPLMPPRPPCIAIAAPESPAMSAWISLVGIPKRHATVAHVTMATIAAHSATRASCEFPPKSTML